MKAWILIMAAASAACDSAETPDRDTSSAADTVAEVIDVGLTGDHGNVDSTPSETEDDDALPDVTFDIDASETVQDTSAPLDRNCEFDARLGNHWPDDARCKACRGVVGQPTTKVVANLIWWAKYDAPQGNRDVCALFPDESCRASIDEVEVVYCENIDSGKTRIVWLDVAVITRGEAEEKSSERGPAFGLLLGELQFDADNVLLAKDALVPGTWQIDGGADRPTVVVNPPRPNQHCSVGSFALGDPAALGVIEDCERAQDTYGE